MTEAHSSVTLPVLPLDDDAMLPGMVVPVDMSEPEVHAAVEAAQAGHDSESKVPGVRSNTSQGKPRVLAVPRIDGSYAGTGAVAILEHTGRTPDGSQAAVLRATARARVGSGTAGPGTVLWVSADIQNPEAPEGGYPGKVHEQARELKTLFTTYLQKRGAWQVLDGIQQLDDPGQLADRGGYSPFLTASQKLELLETHDVSERLSRLSTWIRDYLTELDVAESIEQDVQEGVDKQQREFLLRRQMDAIRKELNELNGTPGSEEDDYRQRVDSADLPEHVRDAALTEVDKLERAGDSAPESGWIRTWLDTILAMPWNSRTDDVYDIPGAREILDADHAGLTDVKERIVEYLAVRKRREEQGLGVVGGRRSGAVLALVGPPGVGKTSLGESVARSMGRAFTRVALGGVRDEAEIRGHRRTYVGALPGRIARAVKEAATMNPVVLLDEVDKLGSDFRGDPTSALLEVLDPAQNHTFRDHYLDVDLDLSDVVFLATANDLESIPAPLLDRMELVELDGYTEDEKVTIAADHLLPRQLEKAGLTGEDVGISAAALRRIATDYTREAGVRGMERTIARVLRKIAASAALGERELPATVDEDDLTGYIGRPKHTPESADRTGVPGVATGLAVTGTGGDVLFVEASLADPETGGSGLTLTGHLGDVMKESAQIALSYLQSHGAELELPVGDLKDRGVHLHVPAGAIPKDGPSAGVTMATALASLLSGRRARSDVGMTGEVSLTGRVLPIGGVKQKLLAAHRAGAATVLIPARNEPDLDDVPQDIRGQLTVHAVSDIREVLDLALEPAGTAEQARPMVA